MNQSILEKISNQIPLNDCEGLESWKPTEDIKVTLKELTHQLKHEIQCHKDLEKQLEKKEKADLICKRLLSLCVSVEDEDSRMTSLRQVLLFFCFV